MKSNLTQSELNDTKALQRRRAYDARNAEPNKDAASRIICERFLAQPAYQRAETVMWYLHCRSEVRTIEVLQQQLPSGKCFVVPYCTQDSAGLKILGLWRLTDLQELAPGMWGILEPPRDRWGDRDRQVHPKQLDLIMTPGVGFDTEGARLGNGVGYYDRLLSNIRDDAVVSGLCYQSQIFPRIIREPHDIGMDNVITEQTVYQGRGRQAPLWN